MAEYICTYTGSSRGDLELSRFFSQKRKERFLTNAFLRHCFSRWLFFFPLILHRNGFRFVSSRLSFSFVYFCSHSFFFFFFTFVYISSVGQRIIAFRSTVHEECMYMYVRLVFCVTSVYIAERLFVFCSTSDSKINFDSAFICLVDWQRCTQVVIRMYEKEVTRKKNREREKEWLKKMSFKNMFVREKWRRVRLLEDDIRMWSSMISKKRRIGCISRISIDARLWESIDAENNRSI